MNQRQTKAMNPNKRSQPRDIPVIKANHIPMITEEEKPKKAGSSFDLPSAIRNREELFISDSPRRRASSAPLTLEASGVAARLRFASDSFQSSYERDYKVKKRRSTIAGLRLSTNRRSWPAWTSQIGENEGEVIPQYSSSFPTTGTFV